MKSSVSEDPEEFWSGSDMDVWSSDREGVELMSDRAGDLELEISVRVFVGDPQGSDLVHSPGAGVPVSRPPSCCFSTFLLYFARAFWNHTCKM